MHPCVLRLQPVCVRVKAQTYGISTDRHQRLRFSVPVLLLSYKHTHTHTFTITMSKGDEKEKGGVPPSYEASPRFSQSHNDELHRPAPPPNKTTAATATTTTTTTTTATTITTDKATARRQPPKKTVAFDIGPTASDWQVRRPLKRVETQADNIQLNDFPASRTANNDQKQTNYSINGAAVSAVSAVSAGGGVGDGVQPRRRRGTGADLASMSHAEAKQWQRLVTELPSHSLAAYHVASSMANDGETNGLSLAEAADELIARHNEMALLTKVEGGVGESTTTGQPAAARRDTAANIVAARVARKSGSVFERAKSRYRRSRKRTSFLGVSFNPLREDIYAEVIKDSKRAINGAKGEVGMGIRERLEKVRMEQENIRSAEGQAGAWALRKLALSEAVSKRVGVFGWRLRTGNGLWRSKMNKIEGRHGTSVSTYFTFLRLALLLNLCIALIYVCAMFVPYATIVGFDTWPQVLQPPVDMDASSSYSDNEAFLGLFTGSWPLNQTFYFIGTYVVGSADNSPGSNGQDYNVGLAYFFLVFAYLVVSFGILLRVVTRSMLNKTVDTGRQQPFCEIVFTAYNYSLQDTNAVSLRCKGLANLLREELAEDQSQDEYTKLQRRWLILRRVTINAAILTILGLCIWAISAVVAAYADVTDAGERLIPSIVLAVILFVVPLVFEALAAFEKWRTPLFKIEVTVVRSLILRLCGLYSYYYTFIQNRHEVMCWETYLGQQVYSLYVVLFVVEVASALFYDGAKRLVWKFVPGVGPLLGPPRFAAIKGTVDLCFSQCLIWFGTFWCPMLPVLSVAKSVIIFYARYASTMLFCEPPAVAFRATHRLFELVSVILFVALLAVSIPLGYIMLELPPSGFYMEQPARWINASDLLLQSSGGGGGGATCAVNTANCSLCLAEDYNNATAANASVCFRTGENGTAPNGIQTTAGAFCAACPSGCGPFRGRPTFYTVFTDMFHSWGPDAQLALDYLSSVGFVSIIAMLAFGALMLMRARNAALVRANKRLRIERDLDRLDKLFILRKFAITLDFDGSSSSSTSTSATLTATPRSGPGLAPSLPRLSMSAASSPDAAAQDMQEGELWGKISPLSRERRTSQV